MSTNGIKRQILRDPFSGHEAIQIIGDKDLGLMDSRRKVTETFNGRNGSIVRFFNPEVTLFGLEEPVEDEGRGNYDIISSHGVDEIVEVQANSTALALESLISALLARSKALGVGATVTNLRQLYAYATYDIYTASLEARLFASKAVPSHIKGEIVKSAEHYRAKTRCLYCDVRDQELKSPQENSLLVSRNPLTISLGSNGPIDKDFVYVMPRHHIARLEELNQQQIIALALAVEGELESMITDLKRSREHDYINIIFHSEPFNYRQDLERLYHCHVELYPQQIAHKGDFRKIPGTGWSVIPAKPVEMAQRMRQLNHQP